MKKHEEMARRIFDCLEEHLHEVPGPTWKPYRYPSGEHKGIIMDIRDDESRLILIGDDGSEFDLIVLCARDGR